MTTLFRPFYSLLVIVALALCACSDDDHGASALVADGAGGSALPPDPKFIEGGERTDKDLNSAYSKIFRAYGDEPVRQFIAPRSLHVMNLKDVLALKVEIKTGDQTTVRTIQEIYKFHDFYNKYQLGYNFGTDLYLFGKRRNQKIIIHYSTGPEEITSTRNGLIALTPVHYASGSRVRSVRERTSYLAHESRHSDCPGGSKNSTRSSCGFIHSQCPSNHGYAGVYACDDLAWGSYSVEALHAKAAYYAAEADSEEQRIQEIVALDAMGRLSTSAQKQILNSQPPTHSEDE